MARTRDLELVSNPGVKLTIPEPERAVFPLAQTIVAVAAVLAGVWWTMFALNGGDQVDPRVEVAANVVRLNIDDLRSGLLSHVRIMSDDARTRATLATAEIDRATIEDVLRDLMEAGNFASVAVFDVRGKATRLVTQMYWAGDPLFDYDPIFQSIPDAGAKERLACRLDMDLTDSDKMLGYRWDIVLRGRGATPFGV